MRTKLLLFFSLALALGACGRDSEPPSKSSQEGDASRGKGIYIASCISCHNQDPSKPGPVGPAIAGSSRDLLEARILRASYPAGYKPKRKTKVMPAQPFLKNSIPHLAAFLNSVSASPEKDQKN